MLTTTRTKNDKNMLKYRVCIGIFLFTFCNSAIPLAVPFTVENVRRAQKKCVKIFFRAPSLAELGFRTPPPRKKCTFFLRFRQLF
jgi:hypothetical protein